MGKATFSGPVAGAYMSLTIHHGDVIGAHNMDGLIPTGMGLRVYAISVGALAATAGTVIIGTSGDTNGYLTTQSYPGVAESYFTPDGALVDSNGTFELIGGTSELRITTAGSAILSGKITLHGYVTAHTSTLDAGGL